MTLTTSYLALGLVLLPVAASADTDCRASLQCVKQVADDCRDYRQYLEEQLALAKTLLNQANERIAAQEKQLRAKPDPPWQPAPPPPSEKK